MSSRQFIPNGTKTRCIVNIKNKTGINTNDYIFLCNKEIINKDKPGYTKTNMSRAMRQSKILTNTYLGGTFQSGIISNGLYNTSLGGLEGQPGGMPKPLRNKF